MRCIWTETPFLHFINSNALLNDALLVDVRAVIHINNLKDRIEGGIGVLSIEKAIVRMETKIEYIIKGVDEIKSEVKSQK
ncbi:MAG: hypothetical protein ACYSOQ_08655 [Planctomycetota bacterium]